ncbi:MAG: hypothetical protein N2V77_05300 [Canidatus Methanoxibalbensis ujae]|nr:hypothetical protein [Candidatus Methanoxibalbensis ujae]
MDICNLVWRCASEERRKEETYERQYCGYIMMIDDLVAARNIMHVASDLGAMGCTPRERSS